MKKFLFLTAFFACLSISLPAKAQMAYDTPEGYWLIQTERAVVHINQCDDNAEKLCGWIYWLIEDGLKYDVNNPDKDKRSNPMCGLELIKGFKRHNEKFWIDGTIYKADDGDLYNATMQIIPPNRLEVRGYVGMPLFGKSQMWSRVDPADYERCEIPTEPAPVTKEDEQTLENTEYKKYYNE